MIVNGNGASDCALETRPNAFFVGHDLPTTHRRRHSGPVVPHLADIALEAAKGVGETAPASQRAATILWLSRPEQRETLAADLDYVVQVQTPVLIDEWQLMPAI